MKNERRQITVETVRSNRRADHKLARWSHQDELASLVGKEIDLTLMHEGVSPLMRTGMLLAADQFAISFARQQQSGLTYAKPVTYFKHAIRSYQLAIE